MRDRETGMISGYCVEAKGAADAWVVEKLVEDISDWGHTDIVLETTLTHACAGQITAEPGQPNRLSFLGSFVEQSWSSRSS